MGSQPDDALTGLKGAFGAQLGEFDGLEPCGHDFSFGDVLNGWEALDDAADSRGEGPPIAW